MQSQTCDKFERGISISEKFSFYFRKIYEKCIEYIKKFFMQIREIKLHVVYFRKKNYGSNQRAPWRWGRYHMYAIMMLSTVLRSWQIIWAPSSEFVSSSIPSWQNLTAHAQPFRGARDLAFCLKVPLDSLLVWASSEGSGETVRMRRLAWTFAARIGYKYQIRLTRSIHL